VADLIAGIRAPSVSDIPDIKDSVSLRSEKASAGQSSFSEVLQQAVSRVESYQRDTQQKVDRFMKGEDQEVHEVVLAAQRSEVAFDYFLQVRNKVIQAYQEVMRMQM
jgi:flagellar hook-basal body complex protein FliE